MRREKFEGPMTLIHALSVAIPARKADHGNTRWSIRWNDRLKRLVDALPSGSGWNHGTSIDHEHSTATKVVLYGSFHHMDENGTYDGWTDHSIIVTPSFSWFDLRITGKNRNDIKDYLRDLFRNTLGQPIEWDD